MNKDKIAIRVNSVSKKFKVYSDKGYTLKERLLFQKRRSFYQRSVLNEISFDVMAGEAVGIIGENGCGKSTMLKLLSKIMFPDQGSIEMHGRVSALIELGAGFHPDMSGRENIYINAAIFGLTKAEIDKRLQTIIDFSELGKYIDNPVRTYSSGMYMRLAFSVAINVDADILLVDEILAVGDAAFQAKCFNKMREIKANGTTIVIVSHSLGQVEQICDRSIWICDGKIREQGKPRNVHPIYLDYMGGKSIDSCENVPLSEDGREEDLLESKADGVLTTESNNQKALQTTHEDALAEDEERWGNGDARFVSVSLIDANGKKQTTVRTGESITIEMKYHVYRDLHSPVFGIGIFRNDDLQCYGTNTQLDREENLQVFTKGCTLCQIETNVLLPGEYTVDVAIHDENGFAYDYWRKALSFAVYSDISDVGVARLEHQWQFINTDELL